MTIQERVLETMFGIAVEEKGVCEKMGRGLRRVVSVLYG